MTPKIEGAMILEGLIEGPLPPFPGMQEKLERWAQDWAKLRMQLQIDAGHFSALPSNEPMTIASLGEDPSAVIAEALADLLRHFPPVERQQVFSTLRSVEWRHKLETRTLYAVGPEGRPATRQERAVCETVAAPEPLSPREMLIRGGTGLLIAAGVLGISALFIDYPKLWRRLTATTEIVSVVATPGTFAPYLQAEIRGIDRRAAMLQIRIIRLPAYPLSETALDALYDHPPEDSPAIVAPATAPAPATGPETMTMPTSAPAATMPAPASLLRRRLAVEALARNAVELEFSDNAGKLLGVATVRIDNLHEKEQIDVLVSAPIVDDRIVVPASVRILP